MTKISIVVPCYNEQDALQYFYDEVAKLALQMPTIRYEFISWMMALKMIPYSY